MMQSRVLHGKKVTLTVEGDINPIELTYCGDFTITLHVPQAHKGADRPIEDRLVLTGLGHLATVEKGGA